MSNLKYTEKIIKTHAEHKGGKLLEIFYLNKRRKIRLSCAKNHEWITEPPTLIAGRWCHECSGYKKGTIDRMKTLALQNEGECLSDTYVNESTKLSWKCKNNHIFITTPGSVVEGHWCPHCAGNLPLSQNDANLLAVNNGGKCLSDYVNVNTKMLWECSEKHQWYDTYNTMRTAWCPICNTNRHPTQERLEKLAILKGGLCLSKYENNKSKVLWQCNIGHK